MFHPRRELKTVTLCLCTVTEKTKEVPTEWKMWSELVKWTDGGGTSERRYVEVFYWNGGRSHLSVVRYGGLGRDRRRVGQEEGRMIPVEPVDGNVTGREYLQRRFKREKTVKIDLAFSS